jgi:chromosome partitioning protein
VRTISITALKGGVGKTVTAHTLAACFAERGKRVLLLDLDAQRTLSAWLGIDGAAGSVVDVLLDGAALAGVSQPTAFEGVEAIAATPGLSGLDRALSQEPGAEGILRAAVEKAPRGRWDVVLIDTPPGLHLATVNALVAAPELLAPVSCDGASLLGLAELRSTVERVRERVRPDVELRHVLPCNIPRTRLARDVLDTLAARFSRELLPGVRSSARVPECFAHGLSILEHDPNGRAAADYRTAASAVLRRTKSRKAKQ